MPIGETTAAAAAASAAKVGAGAGGIAAGAGIFAVLGSFVVMALKRPRTHAEWVVALTSTFVSSLSGGAALIIHFDMLAWARTGDPAADLMGIVALGGAFFVAALPGWALVRAVFNEISKHEGQGIKQVVQELKGD